MTGTHHGDENEQAAWSTGSGAPAPEPDAPAQHDPAEAGQRPTTGKHQRPETDQRGTDQESIAPGRSKPASEPAEDAPPGVVPGVPHEEAEAAQQ